MSTTPLISNKPAPALDNGNVFEKFSNFKNLHD